MRNSCCQLLKASFFFWKSCFDRFMTKGSDFDMHLINDAKYKVNSMRLNNVRLTTYDKSINQCGICGMESYIIFLSYYYFRSYQFMQNQRDLFFYHQHLNFRGDFFSQRDI